MYRNVSGKRYREGLILISRCMEIKWNLECYDLFVWTVVG